MNFRHTNTSTTAGTASTANNNNNHKSSPPQPPSSTTKKRLGHHRTTTAAGSKPVISANGLFFILVVIIALVYCLVVFAFYQHEEAPVPNQNQNQNNNNKVQDVTEKSKNSPAQVEQDKQALRRVVVADNNDKGGSVDMTQYPYWRDLAVKLAGLPAHELLDELQTKDPFGVRQFEKALLEKETTLGRLLEHSELRELFPCPSSRITVPDQRVAEKARAFRANQPGTFLFFQHLRKAGGTHFCSLAKANLPKNNVAQYFCMPDMRWSGNVHAGYLHSWSNADITHKMKEERQRIAGNEWDWFDVDHHFDLPAVFATSFRKPLDRALSQFRFECIEDRGCNIKDVHEWWDKRVDLYNVYLQTFADTPKTFGKLKKTYEDTFPMSPASRQRSELVGRALDTIAKFNLVLAMEFLAYAGPQVQRVLGFHDTSPLTKRVRPHIAQHERHDGQEVNQLGAAGITKASWDPEKYLDPEQYQKMSRHLALDMILTDAARRMFLERLVCHDLLD